MTILRLDRPASLSAVDLESGRRLRNVVRGGQAQPRRCTASGARPGQAFQRWRRRAYLHGALDLPPGDASAPTIVCGEESR